METLEGLMKNYNTSQARYTLNDIEFTNLAGDPIDGLDYTNTSKFEAVINDPFGRLDITNSRFNIGMAWRTIETDEYYTNTNTFGKKYFNISTFKQLFTRYNSKPYTIQRE